MKIDSETTTQNHPVVYPQLIVKRHRIYYLEHPERPRYHDDRTDPVGYNVRPEREEKSRV
jgi:hypothetical protein